MIDASSLTAMSKKYSDMALDGDNPHHRAFAEVAIKALELAAAIGDLPEDLEE